MQLGGRAMLALLLISAVLHTATAATYTVGGSGGWTFQTSNSVFYDNEFTGVTLVVGDVLFFPYENPIHDVNEVSQADLTACNATNPIVVYTQSNATVTLSTPGYHGFICGISGHCALGMHLQVNVSAAATTPPTSTPAPSSIPTPSNSPTSTPISTPPSTTSPPSSQEAPSPETPGSGGFPSVVRSLPAVIVGTLLASIAVLLY